MTECLKLYGYFSYLKFTYMILMKYAGRYKPLILLSAHGQVQMTAHYSQGQGCHSVVISLVPRLFLPHSIIRSFLHFTP
jgi:hypothetical protein